MKKLLLAFCLGALVLAGCSSDKDVEPPAKLVDLNTNVKVRKLWSEGLGGRKTVHLRLALQPRVENGVVYAASHKGVVYAFNAANGKELWHTKTKLALSAGPAVGEGAVVAGSSNGEVIVLDAKTGKERWRHAVSGEVLAAPLVTHGLAIVRTVDGRLQALSLENAAQRWAVEEQVPRLTLRGTAPPILAGDTVIAGADDGKLLAVDVNTGEQIWGTVISAPHGRTELERLVDIDSAAHVAGTDVFVVGFQGRAAMVALDSGQIWWARDLSSYRGFEMDDANLYVSGADSVVVAMRRADGADQWQQNALKRRGLTAPALDRDNLVVGDFEGYVHWLKKDTGEVIARTSTDGDRITNAPVAADGRVFVQTDKGKLYAFEIKQKG
jgi:outer membrane protein assembly factor BamB